MWGPEAADALMVYTSRAVSVFSVGLPLIEAVSVSVAWHLLPFSASFSASIMASVFVREELKRTGGSFLFIPVHSSTTDSMMIPR